MTDILCLDELAGFTNICFRGHENQNISGMCFFKKPVQFADGCFNVGLGAAVFNGCVPG